MDARRAVAGACALCLALAPQAQGQVWQPAPSVGTQPRTFAAGVNVNGTLYAVGGAPWQNAPDNDGVVHVLAPGASVWTLATPLEGMGPIVGGAAGLDALGRIILFGGRLQGGGDPGQERGYDPIDGPNINIAQRTASEDEAGLLAFARDDLGRLYAIGGGPGVGGLNTGYADRYNGATDTWQVIAPMPTPASDACATFDGQGHVLVIGGYNAAGTSRLANVARYTIDSNTWSDTAIPDLPVALSGARAALGADGRVYVVGGRSGPVGAGAALTSVYKLELSTNTWSSIASLATPREHFGLVLGGDDHLYAIGGENDSGGTNSVEKILTPRCPGFVQQPTDLDAWHQTIAGFSVTMIGASPFTFQWRKNGIPLGDGPTPGGSQISGAGTASLTILSPRADDIGDYDVVVTNACGVSTSTSAHLGILTPPSITGPWSVTPIHPAWAMLSSTALGVSPDRIGGEAVTPVTLPDGRVFNLARPVIWTFPDLVPVDITPPGSVGGGVLDVEGDLLAGWFWHTWSCLGGGQTWTCAWRSAGYWQGEPPVFDEVHLSGAEYDSVNATDGMRMVGTVTYEYSEGNYSSRAYLWTPPNSSRSLHPAAATSSGASAIDGERQYGLVIVGTTHAAMWSGTSDTFVDIHPAGYNRSWIGGAADDQAVGTAVLADVQHAGLWAGSASAFLDLHPPGAGSSEATAAEGGVQVGRVNARAAAWIGNAASFVDLGAFLPPGFSSSSANAVSVLPDGSLIIVGQGYNTITQRNEALVWRSGGVCLADFNNSGGTPDEADVAAFFEAWNLGDPMADVNASGGTPDEADVAYFFERWNAGC